MAQFRTQISIPKSKQDIRHEDQMLLLGSCFAEHMGKKLQDHKFTATVNPFGVLYNPESIRGSIESLMEKKEFSPSDLFQYNDMWLSFAHDTEFSSEHVDETLEKIHAQFVPAKVLLKKAKYICITWGTAWVYILKESGKAVSNCHKIPAEKFERRLLSIDEIVTAYSALFKKLRSYNKDIRVIMSVSPVRQWKDGAVQNQLSKSMLIVAIHELMKQFQNIEYFPAYELLMDDLRDYRFYADDMLHPNAQAIQYVWDAFSNCYFCEQTKAVNKEIASVMQALNHRPLHPQSKEYRLFVQQTIENINQVQTKYPFIDLSKEKKFFEEKI